MAARTTRTISGFATAEGTAAHIKRRIEQAAPVMTASKMNGLKLSTVAFGSYRAGNNQTHSAALRKALLAGCNVIDTSANYMNGDSERMVGQVLDGLIAEGEIKRENVFVVSKVGYIQNENMNIVNQRASSGTPFTDVFRLDDDHWHCISPDFISDQLTRSLERLNLDTIDGYLLHNPEYCSQDAIPSKDFYVRIQHAFEQLEREVERGRIKWYGISSNTFGNARNTARYVALDKIVDAATAVSPHNHFAVVQYPFNLFESGALMIKNNSYLDREVSVSEFAAARGLLRLGNRPLNAIKGNRMHRLADFPSHEGVDIAANIKKALDVGIYLERKYATLPPIVQRAAAQGATSPNVNTKPREPAGAPSAAATQRLARAARDGRLRQRAPPPDEVYLCQQIAHSLDFRQISSPSDWNAMVEHQIEPMLRDILRTTGQAGDELNRWAQEYGQAAKRIFDTIREALEHAASEHNEELNEKLDRQSAGLRKTPLQNKAIRVALGSGAIDVALVGMRQPSYVDTAFVDFGPSLPGHEARNILKQM